MVVLSLSVLVITFLLLALIASYAVAAHLPGIEGLPYRYIPGARRAAFLAVLALAGAGELYVTKHLHQSVAPQPLVKETQS